MNKFTCGFLIGILLFAASGICEGADKETDDKFYYNDHGKRNPFWALIDGGGNVINYGGDIMIADMFLEGIMMGSHGNNVAIVNGNVVQKDGKIGEFTVLDIQTDAVILIKDNKKSELRLKKED